MKVLLVAPGPWFSVKDVLHGWETGLRVAGCQVATYRLDERLNFFCQAHVPNEDGELYQPYTEEDAVVLAVDGLLGELYKGWPDVVIVVSCFFWPPQLAPLIRHRGTKVVLLFTESPYEDDSQLERARTADLCLLNDPKNLDLYADVCPAYYQPHSYDPLRHCPGPVIPEARSDFAFVGTGFESRIKFFEREYALGGFEGIDVALAGFWEKLDPASPLRKYLAHDILQCVNNDNAVELYRASKSSMNLYRVEANRPELAEGWAMGPREVELAATGTFFLRDPRGEGDELLDMLPTFDRDVPGDFSDKLSWWLNHDHQREEAARGARAAVAERTFENAARRLLSQLKE